MYEALTGQTPFSGTLVRKILEDVRHKVPDVPSHFGSLLVPKVLSDLTMSCLSKDPNERPSSAEEVVRIIQHNPDTVKFSSLTPARQQCRFACFIKKESR